jgi:LPXTG-motif cell wall-anchored protein
MNNTFFTEFIILAGIVGAILAFLIIRRWREE